MSIFLAMGTNYKKIIVVLGLAALAGCSSTPMPQAFLSHFSSARDDAEHGKCMTDNTPFNNRQLMMAPNTVQDAWTYCVKQSDVWYPGKDDTSSTSGSWEKQ